MAKLHVLINRRILSSDLIKRRAFVCVGNKYRATSDQNENCRKVCTNLMSSGQRDENNNSEFHCKYLLWAAPAFLAHFKKPESDDDETRTWLEKLVPMQIRLMFQKEDDSPEGQLVMTLKRAILCMSREQYEKGEQIIHLALRMAQEMHHTDAITLCYDIMANLALETEQFEKAEKLFVAVLQRLLRGGVKENDIKVRIECSTLIICVK